MAIRFVDRSVGKQSWFGESWFGSNRAHLIVLLFSIVAVMIPPNTADAAERWTSLNGSNTVEADFVGLWGDKVVLELPGSRRVSVSLDDLIADSRIQARRLAQEQEAGRAERRAQILAEAKEAAAPAPTPLPQPRKPPAYQPYTQAGGLLSQLEWLEQQERNGHGLIAWFDTLPASYQTDLERLARAAVAKMDPQGLNQLLRSIHSIGDLVVTRQRWLFSHPRFGAMDGSAKSTLESVVLSFGGLFRDGIDPEQLKIDEIATRSLRMWLVDLDTRMAPHLAAIYDQYDVLGIPAASFEVENEKDGKATVKYTMGEVSQSIPVEMVQGKWWFAEMNAEKWAEQTKAMEDSLAAVPDGSLLSSGPAMMVPVTIQSFLQPAVSASSAREFHAVMDGWLAMASPMVAQLGNFGVGDRRGRSGGYGDDMYGDDMYDMEMEMDMDMEMDGYEDEMDADYGSGSGPGGSGSGGFGPGSISNSGAFGSGGSGSGSYGSGSGPPRGSGRPR